ncbi:MAG: response regulator, partial [Bacteroidales bacterium]
MNMGKYQVLIADDEELTRIGMRYFISMMDDFEVVDEAFNGKDALDKVFKYSPDIILLDIKMPLCSGIDVLKTLHKSGIHSKIVLLSGHKDFLYAQEALKYGACDYLLKPTSFENLKETFSRVGQSLKEEKLLQAHLKQFKEYNSQALSLILPQFYLQIIKSKLNTEDIVQRLNILNIPYDKCTVILVSRTKIFYTKYGIKDNISELQNTKIINHLNEFIESHGMKYSNAFPIENGTFAIMVFQQECTGRDIKSFALSVHKYLSKVLNITFTISIGNQFPLIQASESYEDARRKLNQRFFLGDNRIIWEQEKDPAEDKINYPDFEKKILNVIKNQDNVTLKKLMEDFFRSQTRLRIPKEEWLRFCYEITMFISNLLRDYSLRNEPDSILEKIGIISELTSLEDVKDWLTAIL